LRRLAAASKERQRKAFDVGGRLNNEESVRELRSRLQKVEAADVILRRSDRSLILADIGNKRQKEQRDLQSKAKNEKLQKRRVAHERVAQMMME
jgi:hypothetical protein